MHYELIAFAVIVTFFAGRTIDVPNAVRERWSRLQVPYAGLAIAVVVLVLAEHATLASLSSAFDSLPKLRAFEADFPLRIMGYRDSYLLRAGFGTRFLALAALQAACLAVVALAMRRPSGRRWFVVLAGASLMLIEALVSRTATSGDALSNVGYALLGVDSYAPPNLRFGHDFASISEWWGAPLVPAPYGPLWLAVASVTTAFASTLFAKVVLLRILGAASLAAVASLLRALRAPAAVVAVVILNPALVFEFVANVHNDLFGIAFVLAARLAMLRGARTAAVALGLCAALVKLPFALLSIVAFAEFERRATRIAATAAVAAAALLGSVAASGGAFAAAVAHHVNEHVGSGGYAGLVFSSAFTLRLAAVAALLAYGLARVWSEGFVYAMPFIGVAFHPWYAAWALPYANVRAGALARFLIVLPVIRIVVDTTTASGDPIVVFQKCAIFVLVVASAAFGLFRFRERRTRAMRTAPVS